MYFEKYRIHYGHAHTMYQEEKMEQCNVTLSTEVKPFMI